MRGFGSTLGLALALCLAACTDRSGNGAAGGNEAAETGANAAAGNGAAASFCQFTREQTRNWHASISDQPPNPGALLIVTGEAYVRDPHYKAQLSEPQSAPPVLRLWLTQAENRGAVPADGWHALRFELPNPGDIRTVIIWCDHDTDLAEIAVERPQ
jgi:hypothetical protein